MKYLSLCLLLISTSAFAQQAQPSPEEIQAHALVQIGKLQQALGQSELDLIAAGKRIADLDKQLADAKKPAKKAN